MILPSQTKPKTCEVGRGPQLLNQPKRNPYLHVMPSYPQHEIRIHKRAMGAHECAAKSKFITGPGLCLALRLDFLDNVMCHVEDALRGLLAHKAFAGLGVVLQRTVLTKVVFALGHHGL